MVRFTTPRSIPPLEDVEISLLCGPADGYEHSPERLAELEAAWRAYGAELTQGQRVRRPGERIWGYWRFELGIAQPPTKLERVLELDRRGLLFDDERRQLVVEAEHARKPVREHVVISPRSAREMYERQQREHRAEAAAILAALT